MCQSLAKIVLVIFNFIFVLAGLLMLAFGIVALVKPDEVITILGHIPGISKVPAAFDLGGIIKASAIFMIVLGGVVGAVGFFGCCGACCGSKGLLTAYIVVLVIILCAEVALIIFAAVAPEKLKDTIQKAMAKSYKDYNEDISLNASGSVTLPKGPVSLGWTFLQIGADCCGTYNYTDYSYWNYNVTVFGRTIPATVPISCCLKKKDIDLEKTTSFNNSTFTDLDACLKGDYSYINPKNCYDSISDLIKGSLKIAIGIAAGIVGVEVFLIIFAIVLCRSGDKD